MEIRIILHVQTCNNNNVTTCEILQKFVTDFIVKNLSLSFGHFKQLGSQGNIILTLSIGVGQSHLVHA